MTEEISDAYFRDVIYLIFIALGSVKFILIWSKYLGFRLPSCNNNAHMNPHVITIIFHTRDRIIIIIIIHTSYNTSIAVLYFLCAIKNVSIHRNNVTHNNNNDTNDKP